MEEVFKSTRTLYKIKCIKEIFTKEILDLIPPNSKNIELSYSTKTKILKIDYVLGEK